MDCNFKQSFQLKAGAGAPQPMTHDAACWTLQSFRLKYPKKVQSLTKQCKHSHPSQKFIGDVLRSLEAEYNTECYCLCLEALRILSRENHHLYQLAQKEGILLLMKLAGLEEKPKKHSDQGVPRMKLALWKLPSLSRDRQSLSFTSILLLSCFALLSYQLPLRPRNAFAISSTTAVKCNACASKYATHYSPVNIMTMAHHCSQV